MLPSFSDIPTVSIIYTNDENFCVNLALLPEEREHSDTSHIRVLTGST